MARTGPALTLAAALWLCAPVAHAISQFPGEIRAHLGLGYLPPCNICHATASGGGPMAKAFGSAMRERGLSTADLASVGRALDRMEADQVDSNHNGVTDVQDLQSGVDPNESGNQSLTGPAPEYGCVVASVGPTSVSMSGWASAFALSLLLWSRRARRAWPPGRLRRAKES